MAKKESNKFKVARKTHKKGDNGVYTKAQKPRQTRDTDIHTTEHSTRTAGIVAIAAKADWLSE